MTQYAIGVIFHAWHIGTHREREHPGSRKRTLRVRFREPGCQPLMEWEVEFTDEFGEWCEGLSEGEQDAVDRYVLLLISEGSNLKFPYCSGIEGSRHNHMRELRIQHKGEPYRVFYAFDPRRTAILLIGGCKTGDKRFYENMIPQADDLYDVYIEELKCEGEL